MWILGTFKKEVIFFFLPALFAIAIAMTFPHLGDESVIYGLLATALIDSGHVYTTLWRTFLHPEERKSSSIYWVFPLAICLFFFMWYYFQLPYLWSFVVYATLFHHVRQVYGFSKWYQTLNKRQDKISDFFLYSLSFGPILIYHFRPGAFSNYYSTDDLFLFPDSIIFKTLLYVYSMIAVAWILYERRLWIRGTKELNRLLSVAFPACVYAYCFFVGRTFTQLLFPLLFLHGIAYCAVMGLSLTRTRGGWFSNLTLSLTIVAGTAVVFGLFESFMEGSIVGDNRKLTGFVPSLIVGLYLTPLFCHYVFDAVIWKKNHRESKLILGTK